MAALALSFAFFLFLTVLGWAVLSACKWRGGILRAWLLAPATGLATAVLAIMVLNQLDLPVRAFAWPMTLALAAFTAAIFVLHRQPRHRLAFPARALAPFFGVALFSLLWTGWPALRFNFSWLSYVNDDYVNYCFAAERFKDFGFWRVPTMPWLICCACPSISACSRSASEVSGAAGTICGFGRETLNPSVPVPSP